MSEYEILICHRCFISYEHKGGFSRPELCDRCLLQRVLLNLAWHLIWPLIGIAILLLLFLGRGK